jgi:23S rRNA (uracil1939-C5)-methyltransferase
MIHPAIPPEQVHTAMIDKLVPGGFGLGRLEQGIVVMVRHVLPGEKVVVREAKRKKQYIHAELLDILEESPHRIKPPCPLYGRCGGCDMQHTGYEEQLNLKLAMLIESLQRSGGDGFPEAAGIVDPPLGSPEKFGYRQRIRLHVNTMGEFGFYQSDSHSLEQISHCLLAKPRINEVLEQLTNNSDLLELLQHSTEVELLHNPAGDDVVMLVHFIRKPRPADRSHAVRIKEQIKELSELVLQVSGHGFYDPQTGRYLEVPPFLSQLLPSNIGDTNLKLTWEAGGFCQVNLEQNNQLIKLVVNLASPGAAERILDLFCGQGNFSLPVALQSATVVGLDGQGSAIRSAKRNATTTSSLIVSYWIRPGRELLKLYLCCPNSLPKE